MASRIDVMKVRMEEHLSEPFPTKKEKLEIVKLTSWTFHQSKIEEQSSLEV